MKRYMTGCANYSTIEKAEYTMKKYRPDDAVLEKHKDGSSSIVWLTDKPVQPGQVEYKGNG